MMCKKCVLSSTTPGVKLDQKGICNQCNSHKDFIHKGEENLLKILESAKSKHAKYDCIVNISGGRDSAYTLLKLAKDYKMNVLAVNYENPFTDPQAKTNIQNAVNALEVDIVRFKLKNQIHEKTFKNNFLAWSKKPSPALIPMVCVACKTMWYEIIKIAKKNNVHLIIDGGNHYEFTSFKNELLNIKWDNKYETIFIKSLLGVLKETIKNPAYFHPSYLTTMVKGYLFADQFAIGSRISSPDITRIQLFQYLPWDEHEVLSRITSELNWDYPKRLGTTWRFDCKVDHLKNFLYTKTIGTTEKEDFYSRLIRENKITRQEALERLKIENKIQWDDIKSLMDQVGIPGDQAQMQLENLRFP
jgi:PP-loop superfamily ATP-utilizing enzyme